ncbi:MAG: high-affinity branched-chain amino acid ABC transporter ATP-binding protein LivG [Chloroflexi bacterium]|nr:MAG: high-affinity branched-chain amino acid ABC transporter ATP-binding protein LivG [Chloroflexota bacterium]
MTSAPPLLQIEGLTHFFGGLAAVSDFSTTLHDQELVGLIGPNGAGKTTVFNLVCGLYRPAAGELFFSGTRLNGRRPHQITSLGIGRTFQNIRLWNELSVLDNLRIAHFSQMKYGVLDTFFLTPRLRTVERQVTAEAMELLRLFSLERYFRERPRNLPYGVQRRVEISRALVMKPRLLLLDEPAAGMNQGEIGELMELIQWVREQFKVTVWIIEHQMRVIMGICERIQVLDFGQTIAEGTPEEIRHHPRVIEAYLGEEVV